MSEISIIKSPLISNELFFHGFPKRHGGVSIGPRGSLNLGHRWGDPEDNVLENRRRLAKYEGFDIDELVVTKHMHGIGVWTVGEELPDPPEFDGLVSDRSGTILGAFAADCIPMIFADPEAKICGAAHSGWRGTVAGISRRVVERMVEAGSKAEHIRVALGPSIGPCCFEVGLEVVEEFTKALPNIDGLVVQGPVKEHVNLRVATRAILQDAGVLAEHIDDQPPCTKCNPDDFFSYRRDGKGGGVHMGFIGLKPSSSRST